MKQTEIGCEEALRQLLTFLDGELSAGEQERVDEHLRRCRSCWTRAEFERRLKRQLADLGPAPVRPQLMSRVRSLMSKVEKPGE